MQIWYLTPSSIGYLTQLILNLAITFYLLHHLRLRENRSAQTLLLTGFFAVIVLFVGLLFLDAVSLPTPRLYFVYLENTALAGALLLLLQFVYRFPVFFPSRKREARIVLGLSLLYFLYEAQYAIYRFSLLLGQGDVDYRIPQADYALAILFVWVPVAFFRQAVAADARPIAWWRKLWKPRGLGAHGARLFALIFIPLFALSIVNILRAFSFISTTTYSASLSLGILVTLFLFAAAYLNYLPENTSFLGKLSGITLTLLLAALGLVGWAVTPAHVAAYRPLISDHQTLRYTPNSQGGYSVAEIPFNFETDLGEKLNVTSRGDARNQWVDFHFPFYGKLYHEISVTSVGVLIMGQKLYHPNLQNEYGQFPAIMPLLVDLEPANGGGVFARLEGERLLVTWDHLPALSQPESIFTFQAVLYPDGSFDVTYNGLPNPLVFDADATPSANPWLRGVTPGTAEPVEQTSDILRISQSGPRGVIQDFYMDFRVFLNDFITPLAWLVVLSSLFLVMALPLLIRVNLVQPLNALLAGIKQVEDGDLDVEMPVAYWDEIGSLTSSFNSMTLQLRSLVTHLEQRVAERTQQLQSANERLQNEVDEREVAESRVVQQARDLAAAEEREKMGRDLHDGFGQVIGFVNVQAQAAQTLLEKNQVGAAQENLERIVQAAQEAHIELRHAIFGLRDSARPQRSFYGVLRESLRAFNQAWGIETVFSPAQSTLPMLPEAVEDQLLHIIQEALVNIRKHAEARRVEVLITTSSDEIVFIVSDDGRGFDPQDAPGAAQKHFGLGIMRERAEQIGGRLELRSVVGQGSRVLVHIPRVLPSVSKDDLGDIHGLRILLVDDQPLFLDGMRNLLTARGLTVIGLAHDGLEALEQVKSLRPDVVIMDVQMPNCDGIEATRLIKAEFPEIKVVLLTVSEEEEHLLDAVKYGASGYLLKSLDARQIFSMLGAAVRGENQIAPGLAARLLAEFNRPAAAPRSAAFRAETIPADLTMRQWEVLRLVARGLTYKEAGNELNLTERAIKYHMAQILERLHLENREQGIAYVRQFQEGRRKKGT
ncbi:MAG: response regulator [Chloroflexi bacterium]|nr:response regulator [Chloroflexota bacterium]